VTYLLDAMLGKLATYLRIAGHDAAYALDRDAETADELLALADREERTLLTRDTDLAARADDAILLTERDVVDQLHELDAAGVRLSVPETPVRCGRCNGPLSPVEPSASTPAYAPDAGERDVYRCDRCGQHFWAGSHIDDVRERLPE
jgi:uncharacterized protein with PIN domain